MSVNNFTGIGNLSTDPIRKERGDNVLCSFKLAMNRPPRADGSSKTDYVWVTAWGKQAEAILANLTKGSEVCVEGSIDAGDVKQADDTYKSYFGVNAQRVHFLRRSKRQEEAMAASEVEAPEAPEEPKSDDIPF